jgi:hypothetical protein
MTTIIDVDCHFDVPITPDEHPLAAYADQLPPLDAFIADSLTGDLLQHTPEASRPRFAELALPADENTSSAERRRPGRWPLGFLPVTGRPCRLADRVGIDHAFVSPGGYGFLLPYVGNDRRRRRCNDSWLMPERLHGSARRAFVDWTEHRHVDRGAGADARQAQPCVLGPGGTAAAVSPGHPALDPLWAARPTSG